MPTSEQAFRASRFSFGRFLLGALVTLVLVGAGWLYFAWHWSYSHGERAGWVQKFSEKGWLCKTWEGEMAMVTMPGTLTEKFEFTADTAAVAQQINESVGKRVALTYVQRRCIPSSCFGDTEYFVTAVRVVQ
jgi:hypothetical protein